MNFSALLERFYPFLIRLPAILIAMSVHELCHGWVADRLGDPTPRATGRLSLNPLRHIHPIGFLSLLLVGFGFAKPVQVNAQNFKNPRRDMALVAVAGPLSNLLMAFFGMLLFVVYYVFWYEPLFLQNPALSDTIFTLISVFCTLNLSFFAFNMIPLPPLDGSHILFSFLPLKWYYKARRYEHVFHYVFLGLILLSILSSRVPALGGLDILGLTLGRLVSWLHGLFADFWLFIVGLFA